jgi:deazaflavin-dependent oxidoreductase (nitroreductase family)
LPPKRLIPASVTKLINSPLVNGVMRPLARLVPGLGIVIHRGRKSGREYRTPVTMIFNGGRVIVPLAHGEGVNWVRNVMATGVAEVEQLGKRRTISNPRVVDSTSGEQLPLVFRLASRGLRFFVADV